MKQKGHPVDAGAQTELVNALALVARFWDPVAPHLRKRAVGWAPPKSEGRLRNGGNLTGTEGFGQWDGLRTGWEGRCRKNQDAETDGLNEIRAGSRSAGKNEAQIRRG